VGRRAPPRQALLLLALVAAVVVAQRVVVKAIVGGNMPPVNLDRTGPLNVAIMTANMLLLHGSIDFGYNVVAFGPGADMAAPRLWLGAAAWTLRPLAPLGFGFPGARAGRIQ